jgi:3-phenylpropionate/cinnamic acid dioxygenase small subunit
MTWPTAPLDAILQTIARYGQLADDRRLADVGDLFTEDGRLEVRGTVWEGRAEIVARGGDGPDPGQRTKHVAVNPLVDVAADGRTADVRTDFLYFVAPPEGPWRLSSTGRYVDVHVLDGDRWRIRSRAVTID